MANEVVLIAEKPSVASSIVQWLAKNGKSVNFDIRSPERKETYVSLGEVAVAHCVGHILEAKMPEDYIPELKRWRLADLPFIPQRFELKIKQDKAPLVRAIGHLLKTAKLVIHAGDPDEEGQLLVSEVLEFFGYTGPVKRLWLNAVDDATIAKAFANLRPNAEFQGYYESARARSESDWLVGINFTRACSVVGKSRGATSVLSVGRVQTPTLGLIVRREREIRDFKPSKFFVPWIDLEGNPSFRAEWRAKKEDDRLDDQGRLVDIGEATKIIESARAGGQAVVKKYSAEKKNEPAPMPFSLSTLQAVMSSRHGMGVKKTLDVAQRLYEKKITSYPRTDCEYLIESQHADAGAILTSLAGIDAAVDRAISRANPQFRSQAWNSSKATAHHGIIPLRLTGKLPSLDDDERKVYLEIVKRYCLQFWPPAQYLAVSIELTAGGESYTASGRSYLGKGWRLAFSEEDGAEDDDANPADKKEVSLPELNNGDVLAIAAAGKNDGVTRPPSRYTEGTLVDAMKKAHRFVSNEKLKKILKDKTGIGTEATRASVITNLVEKGYIKSSKKSIVPTELGEKLFDALPSMLTTVDLTAFWQQEMDEMLHGNGKHEPFVAKQVDLVRKMLPTLCQSVEKATFGEIRPPIEERATTEICPSCGGALRNIKGKFGWFFGCSTESCKKVFRDENGKPVEAKRGEDSGHRCPACKKSNLLAMEGQYGKYFKCGNDKCAKIFNAAEDGKPSAYHPCPRCKKGHLQLRKGSKGPFWGCSNFKTGCRYATEDNNGVPASKPEKEVA